MSVLGSILGKIFGSSHAQAAPASTASPSAPNPAIAPSTSVSPAGSSMASKPVDVALLLDGMAEKAGQKLNWRTSIVDLMKLLGLDSNLEARKELAKELSYPGDTGDSAAMNIWLHKQVMEKLAANGGKLPPDLSRH